MEILVTALSWLTIGLATTAASAVLSLARRPLILGTIIVLEMLIPVGVRQYQNSKNVQLGSVGTYLREWVSPQQEETESVSRRLNDLIGME